MKKSRKQIIVQIEVMDRYLQSQKDEVIEHKEYFAQSGIARYHLITPIVLVSAFFIGWRAARIQWSGKVTHQAVEIGALALLNSFKKTVVSLFT
ncbi:MULTISPECIES: hypothetical protein [Legionella]|uniref:Uncharacterized protein n=1 Tax=Legionella resiliens TaxID=2905958 RepID=A0ABS8X6W7_9GAMM|nr:MULTISPECIES: hypothetical protein [unclassified Legionella]MCE0724509.1 hypothetical protein [Legionella sp. 9fVS26]MCE3533662.1 hypothetical protein [Legionella sp. 8cVS16]QLZ69853.1 hypothetical protein FOLKNPGA_02653 [Legionella sp. PC1000]